MSLELAQSMLFITKIGIDGHFCSCFSLGLEPYGRNRHGKLHFERRKDLSTVVMAISSAVGQWSPEPASKAVGQALGPFFGAVAAIAPDDYVYGNIHKRYREVYVNGVFSYYQTEYTVTAWLHHDGKDIYGGETTEYYEGTSPMRLEA